MSRFLKETKNWETEKPVKKTERKNTEKNYVRTFSELGFNDDRPHFFNSFINLYFTLNYNQYRYLCFTL